MGGGSDGWGGGVLAADGGRGGECTVAVVTSQPFLLHHAAVSGGGGGPERGPNAPAPDSGAPVSHSSRNRKIMQRKLFFLRFVEMLIVDIKV